MDPDADLRARAKFSIIRDMKFWGFLALGATLCLTGCLSTEIGRSDLTGAEYIYGSDCCWKLFNCIPIFTNDISQDRVQQKMAKAAAKRGKTVTGIVSHNYENVLFEIPLLFISIPVPYLFCYHEIQLSGTLQ